MSKKLVGLVVLITVLGLAQASLAAFDPNTDPSLVGWWKLDEKSGTTAADSSTNKNNGTVSGDAVWGAGRVNGCLQFDGSNDYVDMPIGSIIKTLSSATFAVWANYSRQGGAWQRIFDIGTGETVNMFLTPAIGGSNAGQMRFAITIGGNGAESQLTAPGQLASGWHHVAVVLNGDSRAAQLYLDGVVVASGTTNTLPRDMGSTTHNWLGRSNYGADAYYQGSLDDFRIYGRALSTQEVKALMPPVLKATNPSPANGATGVATAALSWTPADTAVFVDIYVGTTPDLTAADKVKRQTVAIKSLYATKPPLEPGQTYYWRVDSVDAKGKLNLQGDVWSFTMAPVTAFAPVPADTAMYQSANVDLAWTPGQNAFNHEVYFSTNQDEVTHRDPAVLQGSLVVSTLELPPLALNTTYYWCVDEIDALGDTQVGKVWSFTTTIPGLGAAKRELWLNGSTGTTVADLTDDSRYPGAPSDVNEVPNFDSSANLADNYGGKLSAWLYVPVAGEYTFWIASDDSSQLWFGADADSAEMIASVSGYTGAGQYDQYASQKSKVMTLEAGRYYLMALWKDGTGGDFCQVAWQGAGIPNRELITGNYLMPFEALWAFGPRPRDGAVDTTQAVTLKWTAGTKATTHQIYFSEDKEAVVDGTASRGQQAVDNTTFNPGTLEFGKTYYWRVDEVNPAEADSPWEGTIWSFTTADFIVVDDFEDYVDDVVGRIFQTWIDGWGYTEPAPGNPGNGTGSAVGYANAPFAERTVVKTGVQSMPLAYNNADSPYYSEADRTWDTPQNWTINGMNTLSLQVRGFPQLTSTSVTETGGKVNLTGAGADIWNNSDEFTYAYKSLSGDGTIIVRVASTGTGSNTWAKGGVMIRDSLDGGSMHAMMVITGGGGNGASFQYRNATDGASGNSDSTVVIAPPYWVKLERLGDSFSGYISADGAAWANVGNQDVVMTAPVYIGLCVTSHAAGEDRTFQFDNIKTTGSVTGPWQGAVISSPKYNSPQDFYVVVTDSANKSAVVTNATVVNAADWTEVQMPLSSFTGVSMTKVKKMTIGIGNRNAPAADGTGMLFIDDIRVIKP